jgi:hypothetical protein
LSGSPIVNARVASTSLRVKAVIAGPVGPCGSTTTDRPGLRYVGPQTLADLTARIRSSGKPATILLRLTQAPGMADKTAETCLKEAGFTLQQIPLQSKFIIDNNRVEVGAFQVGLQLP